MRLPQKRLQEPWRVLRLRQKPQGERQPPLLPVSRQRRGQEHGKFVPQVEGAVWLKGEGTIDGIKRYKTLGKKCS